MLNRIGRIFNKKRILTIALVFLVFVMSLGYATLQEHMDIDGVATIDRSWIVKISESYCDSTGSATIISTNYISNTFTINASVPSGSTVNCTLVIGNQGNVKAKFVSTDVISENGEAVPYTLSGPYNLDGEVMTTLGFQRSAIFTIKLVPRSSSETNYNVTYMVTFNYIEDAPTSGSNNKDGTSFSTGSYEVFRVGQYVETVDGNKWWVTKDTGAAEDLVSLVSIYPIDANGNITAYAHGNEYKRAFDTAGSADYNKFSSTNVGYFLENTFLPKIRSSLYGSGGDTTQLSTRLLTSEEFTNIEKSWYNNYIDDVSLFYNRGYTQASMSYYSRWLMDKNDLHKDEINCTDAVPLSGYKNLYLSITNEGQEIPWDYRLSTAAYGPNVCLPSDKRAVIPVIIVKKSAVKKNLASEILMSNGVQDSATLDFSRNAKPNGNGVYHINETPGVKSSVYFYRGNIKNNNVIFANYCWKIVRTTFSGGIKLIYNGTKSSSGTCNNTGTATQLTTTTFNPNNETAAYIGYMYGSNTSKYNLLKNYGNGHYAGTGYTYSNNKYTLKSTKVGADNTHHYTQHLKSSSTTTTVGFYFRKINNDYYYLNLSGGKTPKTVLNEMFNNSTNSLIKNYIENTWYASKMTAYTSKLEDAQYIADRNVYDYGGWDDNGDLETGLVFCGMRCGVLTSTSKARAIDKFTVSTSKGNGKLKYPVGLLTVDEAYLAGGNSSDNSNYYLYTGQTYWTMSPSDIMVDEHAGTGVWIVNNYGRVTGDGVEHSNGIRPVITLKIGTIYTSGNGTASSPYIVT